MSLRFSVLGPVEISVDGTRVDGTAPRHRAILAYLLLHARTVIGTDRLIGAVWGSAAPDTARAQVHAAIAAIRRVLRDAGADGILQTRAAGYVIQPGPDGLDLTEFNERTAAAQAAGDRSEAAEELRRALALWRGSPFADITAVYAAEARSRLEQRRLAAFERLAELEIASGRHERVIDELAAQVAVNPLRERLSSHFMLALDRAGRRAEALAAARAFRTVLADEQGLDPGKAFVQLEQSILRGTTDPVPPAADTRDEPVSAAKPAPPVSFLPYGTPDFAGRQAELDRLTEAAAAGGGIVTIDGMAGIGKTALAVHAGYRLADRYPNGLLFVDLRAHTTGQKPMEHGPALDTLLSQLGVPPERRPVTVGECAALLRAELTERRFVVVLDNAADTAHVRPMLPGTRGSLFLVTSRRRLSGLDGARAVSLDLMAPEEAVELFTSIVGDRAVAEPIATVDVLHLCGFLPLAVRIAAARLQHRPRWTVEYLADRLRDQRRRLTELSTEDRGVVAVFTMSYQQLDPWQRRMFRLLGLFPGPDVDACAAAALADTPLEKADDLLEDLLDAHVLLQREPGRYTLHDLLREYARATVEEEETIEARHAAVSRLLDHYLYTSCAAVDLLFPDGAASRPRIAKPSTALVPLESAADATAWLEAERANLISAAEYAVEHDWPSYTGDLAKTLHRYLDAHAHHTQAIRLLTMAVTAHTRLGDETSRGLDLYYLSVAYWRQGRYEKTVEQARLALEIFQQAEYRTGQSWSLTVLAAVHWRLREYDEAALYYQRSLDLAREAGDRQGEAAALGGLGIALEGQGQLEEARRHQEAALAIHQKSGQRELEAVALGNLGSIHAGQDRYGQAAQYLRSALDIYRTLGSRVGQTDMLNALGETATAMGDAEVAVREHGAALELAGEIGSDPERARADGGLARAHLRLGDTAAAREHAKRALALYEELGLPEAGELRTLLEGLG